MVVGSLMTRGSRSFIPRPLSLAGAAVTRDLDDGGPQLLLPRTRRGAGPRWGPLSDLQAPNLPESRAPTLEHDTRGVSPRRPWPPDRAAPWRANTGDRSGLHTYRGQDDRGVGHAALPWHDPSPSGPLRPAPAR